MDFLMWFKAIRFISTYIDNEIDNEIVNKIDFHENKLNDSESASFIDGLVDWCRLATKIEIKIGIKKR